MHTEGIIPPVVNHEITYEIKMKEAGPFRYFVPDLSRCGPQWHEKRIRELLGRHNIRALTVEKGEDWLLTVGLVLTEPTFKVRRTIFGQPVIDALAEVSEYLPHRYCECVDLLIAEPVSLYEY